MEYFSDSFRKNQLKTSYEATDLLMHLRKSHGKLEHSDEAIFTSAS